MNRLKGQSLELVNGYKELWRDVNDDKQKYDDLRKRYDRMARQIESPRGEQIGIRDDKKLIRKCEDAVYERKRLKVS